MTVILLRHGRSTSNTAHTLAGRSEGVDLDDKGREQAAALVDRIGDCRSGRVVSSPLLRCRRTVEPLAAALGVEPVVDDRLTEVDYGEWTGRKIGELVKEPLWAVVQQQPSAAVFPGGEGLAEVQARAVAAVREHDRGWPRSTAATCCGWPARTATSSRRSSPTRWASIWTASSASPPIRPR